MKITILDKSTLGEDIDLSPIKALGETEIFGNTLKDEVANRVTDCDVVIVNKIKLGEQNLKNTKNLKLICVAATGYDNVDIAYCTARKPSENSRDSYYTTSIITRGILIVN